MEEVEGGLSSDEAERLESRLQAFARTVAADVSADEAGAGGRETANSQGGVAAGLPVCAFVAAAALWHKLASETTGIQCCGGGNTNTTTGGGNQRCSCCKFTLGAMGLCKSSTVDLRLRSSLR